MDGGVFLRAVSAHFGSFGAGRLAVRAYLCYDLTVVRVHFFVGDFGLRFLAMARTNPEDCLQGALRRAAKAAITEARRKVNGGFSDDERGLFYHAHCSGTFRYASGASRF